MTEQKLTELLRDMSLEEKVNQMSQVTGGFFNGEIVVTGPMADKGIYRRQCKSCRISHRIHGR